MKIFNIKRKKASLSLSMNAIVILILAIAMLGLGLTFIRGIFKGITAKVEEAVSAGEIVNPPTRDTPVTITPSNVDLRVGEKGQVKVAFMNIQPDKKSYTLKIYGRGLLNNILCASGQPTVGNDCEVRFVYHTSSLIINKDDINLYTAAIDPSQTGVTGQPKTYLFSAVMECAVGATDACTTVAPAVTYTKDFVVVVQP